jgi:large subunit ribosomal protein L24e
MAKCTFCGREVPRGTGKMFVKKDATILWFDSKKCEKNMLKLGRVAREQKWTESYRKERIAEKK